MSKKERRFHHICIITIISVANRSGEFRKELRKPYAGVPLLEVSGWAQASTL
ncbi:MAG: hypothetical protein ACSLFH_07230 [Desulfuromonadales bacterium]